MTQLPLQVTLNDHAVFSSFLAGPNGEPVERLRSIALGTASDSIFWLWGGGATGKSHLLQAVCAQAYRCDFRPVYLPLGELMSVGPDAVEGLERCDIACFDDIQLAAGDEEWETAVFRLFNRVLETGRSLIVAADCSPAGASFALPDLRSRFASGLVYHLQALDEDQRLEALQLRAKHRGLVMPDETAGFLIKRHRRDMRSLYGLLDSLDQASLAAQRRLTIPFVKSVLQRRS